MRAVHCLPVATLAFVVSAACGASERLLNNVFLASVGAMAPKGIDPRLL